jgi:hypothetical protein
LQWTSELDQARGVETALGEGLLEVCRQGSELGFERGHGGWERNS